MLAELERQRERVVSRIAAARVEDILDRFAATKKGEAELQSSVNELFSSVDVSEEYASARAEVQSAVESQDYVAALRIFPTKGLSARVAGEFGITAQDFIPYLQRVLKSDRRWPLLTALRGLAPNLQLERRAGGLHD